MSSLYLHIPYCQRKCDYCDFFSAPLGTADDLQQYVDLLLLDLAQRARQYPAAGPLRTIFFGGGTPSLLSAGQIDSILEQIKRDFGLADKCEISLEANPGTVNLKKLHGYRQAGVNRLSLGVQTLNDQQLQALGRIHTANEARQAVSLARQAGFANVSLDLIFALPGQTHEQLAEDIAGLLALQPQHLSLYGLTLEPDTPLYSRLQSGQLREVDEQLYADSYLLIHQRLLSAGFEHYEISNFARPGHRCQHNQTYWQRQTCLAAGCGAHGFTADGWGERWFVPPDLPSYRQKLSAGESTVQQLETFSRQSAMAETAYLALRTADGLSRTQFMLKFGTYPEEAFAEAFRCHADRLTLRSDNWSFDVQDWLLYDHLISDFL